MSVSFNREDSRTVLPQLEKNLNNKIEDVQNEVNLLKADYIVEQGTSGIWTYRKWNSGIAECWGRTGIVVPTNGVYSVAFPTGLFIRVSHLSVNPYYGEQSDTYRNASKYIVTDGSNNYNANTTDYAVAYVRDSAGNSQNPYIAFDFNAYGTWK